MSEFDDEYWLKQMREEELEQLNNNKDWIDKFKIFIKKTNVQLYEDNFNFSPPLGIIANYPNIVFNINKSLIPDKENLFSFKSLCEDFKAKKFSNGLLYADNYILMAHSLFRRAYHKMNNYAPRFIDLFWELNDDNIDTFIALDTDRVRINIDNTSYAERDFWYGAKFKNNIGDIKNEIVKLRPPVDLLERHIRFFFADAYCLDIQWYQKANIKVFQAEEFKTEEITIYVDNVKYYPVRYIHAEYDLDKGYFRHFDGAIHFYTAEEYFKRRDSDFNYNQKNPKQIKTKSQKLFKMNGIIRQEVFIEFASHFLTSNPLTFEYFEGCYPEWLEDKITLIRLAGLIK